MGTARKHAYISINARRMHKNNGTFPAATLAFTSKEVPSDFVVQKNTNKTSAIHDM